MTAGLAVLAVLVGLVAVGWLVATIVGLVRMLRDPTAEHDLPSALLALACRRLSDDRNDWGRALHAELASINGRRARWSFALGGVWTTIGGRLGGRLDRPSLAIFVGSAVVCGGLVITGLAAYPNLLTDPRTPPCLVVITIVLLGYAIAGVAEARRAGRTSGPAIPGRHWWVVTGVALGLLWIVFASGWLDLHGWPLILAAVLSALAGAGPARTHRGWRAGFASVTRVALVAGLFTFIVSVLEALATADGPYDASQLQESAAHGYTSAAAYWMGEGLATSLLLSLMIPLCTVALGTIGAAIGQFGRSRPV